jgi:hypothetical protein
LQCWRASFDQGSMNNAVFRVVGKGGTKCS